MGIVDSDYITATDSDYITGYLCGCMNVTVTQEQDLEEGAHRQPQDSIAGGVPKIFHAHCKS